MTMFMYESVPILGYTVTITNTTSGENETMLVEDTTLLYSIDYPDPENNFTVTVVPINEVRAGQPANSEPFLFPLPGKKLRMHKLLYHYNQKTFASLWYLTGSTLITNALLACFTNQKHWHVYASVVLIQIVWGSTYWMHYHACMTAATHLHASTLGRVHVTMPSLLWPRSRLLSFDLLILKICCLSCGTGRPFKVKR